MADKKYKITFEMSDGSTQVVEFTAPQGEPGTSVTIKSISESTEDGGSNVVTFSDGNTLTVKNGMKGNKGDAPVPGVDYWTDADKEEIINEVLAEIPESGGSKGDDGTYFFYSDEYLSKDDYNEFDQPCIPLSNIRHDFRDIRMGDFIITANNLLWTVVDVYFSDIVQEEVAQVSLCEDVNDNHGIYTLAEGETIAHAPWWATVVVDPYTEAPEVEMVATFVDGTTSTFVLCGEVK